MANPTVPDPTITATPTAASPDGTVRPTGTWVIGGFLLIVVLAIWFLVSVLFLHRAGGTIPT